MNQMRCQVCGRSLPLHAKFCPQCGEPVASSDHASPQQAEPRQGSRQTNRRDLLILGAVFLVVTVGYFVFKKPEVVLMSPASEVTSPNDVATGDMNEAMQMFENLPTDYSSLVALGNKYMDERNYPVAAECYQRALALNGDSLDVRVDYGACLHGMGLPRRAIEEFRRVIEMNPSHALAIFDVGIVYYDLNEIDSARVYWQKYLTLDPNGKAAEVAHALLEKIGE